nr:protein ZINC INDUCED FACILITATOR 1-like isoform X1 [Ipomoea batatas]
MEMAVKRRFWEKGENATMRSAPGCKVEQQKKGPEKGDFQIAEKKKISATMQVMWIFSLWAESPRRLGGLGYSTDAVGVVLAISALRRAFGPVTVMRIAGIMSIPLLTSYPYIANLSGISLSLVLSCASLLKSILNEQDQRAAANGVAMTGMSIFKTIGPAGAGALFSWSEKRQDAAFLPGRDIVIKFVAHFCIFLKRYEALLV